MTKILFKTLMLVSFVFTSEAFPEATSDSPAVKGLGQGLISSIYKGEIEAVKFFLDSGVSPNTRSESGKTALMLAAEKGQLDILQVLLARGADKKLTFKSAHQAKPMTAYDLAMKAGHPQAARLLQK